MKKLLVSLLIAMFAFSGCGLGSEKSRYIDAVTEATCLIFGSDDIMDPSLEEKTKEIFRDHGFDADDEQAMVELAQKYDADVEVQEAIEEALDECAGDFMEGLGDVNLEEELDGMEVEGEVEGTVEEEDGEETLDEASDEVPAEEATE